MKGTKAPGVDDITVEELEAATMGTQSDSHGMEALSHSSHTHEGQTGLLKLQGH